MSDEPTKNTDRELWRETPGDYYAPSLHVTENGGIGINVDGFVFVKSLREWHRLAWEEVGRVGKSEGGKRLEASMAGPCVNSAPTRLPSPRTSEPAPRHKIGPQDAAVWHENDAEARKVDEPAPPSAEREVCWLIERGQAERHVPTVWWAGKDYWTQDAVLAVRFPSRLLADTVIKSLSRPVGDPFGRATEHVFLRNDKFHSTPPGDAGKGEV